MDDFYDYYRNEECTYWSKNTLVIGLLLTGLIKLIKNFNDFQRHLIKFNALNKLRTILSSQQAFEQGSFH